MYTYDIPADHPCFAGHFPGHPILPGVLLLNRVLNSAQIELAMSLDKCTIYNAKFSAAVVPNDQITINITSTSSTEYKFTVHIVRNAPDDYLLACSGQLRVTVS